MIQPEDLDRNKLTIVSIGSVCGMGIGILIGLLFNSFWYQVITGVGVFILGLVTLFQNIYLLMVHKNVRD